MNKTIKPSILVYLGDYSNKLLNFSFKYFPDLLGNLLEIIYGIELSEFGLTEYYYKSDGSYKKELNNEIQFNSDLSCVYRKNNEIIIGRKELIKETFIKAIDKISSLDVDIKMKERGFLKSPPQIFIVSPLFDSIGSISILPILEMISELKTVRQISLETEVHVIGFLDNLSEKKLFEEKKKEAARCYACLTEIDHAITKSKNENEDQRLANFVWIVGNKNDNEVQVGTLMDIAPVLSEFFISFIQNKMLDKSFTIKFNSWVDDKYTQFSSFGISKLIYPQKFIFDRFNLLNTIRVIEKIIFNVKYDRNDIYAKTRSYLLEHNFDRIDSQLALDDSESNLWQGPKFHEVPKWEVDIDDFLNNCLNISNEFERRDFNLLISRLSFRKDELLVLLNNSLSNKIFSIIDDHGLCIAEAFLSVLLNVECEYLRGEPLDLELSLASVEDKSKSFYQSLLGIDVLQKEIIKKEEDLKSKQRLLKDIVQKLKNIQESTEVKNSHNDSRENDKSSDQVGNSNTKEESIIENLNRQLNNLGQEITVIKSDLKLLYEKYYELDTLIYDSSKRRELKENQFSDDKDLIYKTAETVRDISKLLYDTSKEYDRLIELKKTTLFKLFYIFPIPVIFLILLGWYFLNFEFALLVNLLLIVGYSITGYIHYKNKVGNDLEKVENKLKLLQNNKLSLLLDIQNQFIKLYYNSFEHLRHSFLIELIREFSEFSRLKLESIKKYRLDLIRILEDSKQKNGELKLVTNQFLQSIISEEEISDLYHENSGNCDYFFRHERNSLSSLLKSYLENTSNEKLFKNIEDYTSEQVNKFEMSVEDGLFDKHKVDYINTKIKILYDSSSSLIKLSTQGDDDTTEDFQYIYIDKNEKSKVFEIIKDLSQESMEISSNSDKYSILLIKYKIGFPIFHVQQLIYCKKILDDYIQNVDSSDIKYQDFFLTDIDLDYDIFPVDQVVMNNENQLYKYILSGIILNIIIFDNDKENLFYKERKLGANKREASLFLINKKEKELANCLTQEVNSMLKIKENQEILSTYYNKDDIEQKDKKILSEIINEMSEL